MFYKFIDWIKRTFNRLMASDAPVNLQISDKMQSAIAKWVEIYESSRPSGCHRLRLGGAISSEVARLTTIEMSVTIEGSQRADYISEQMKPLLDNIRNYVEFAAALGGIVFKPYVSDGQVIVDAIQADCFLPTEFDSMGKMVGGIFFDQVNRDNKVFTRIERRSFSSGKETIWNYAFQSKGNTEIGNQVPLTDVPEWGDIEPVVSIENLDQPLFSYFKMPHANRVDRHSPLGMSVFADCIQLLQDADSQYDRYIWEYEGGEMAIDVAEDLLRHGPDGRISVPKNRERLYRSNKSGDPDFYEAFAPQLRDESYRSGLDNILKRIEFQCGLAYGTLSDPTSVEKTATEIRASRQRSYSTIADIQKSLEQAIFDLLYAVDQLATLYNLAPVGGYSVSFDWDDSIINDPSDWISSMREDVEAGLLRPEHYIKIKYQVDDAQAQELIPDGAQLFGVSS